MTTISGLNRHLKEAFALVSGRSFHLRIESFSRAIVRHENGIGRRRGLFWEELSKARQENGGPLPVCEYELARILRHEK
jgi:hypothetical protein